MCTRVLWNDNDRAVVVGRNDREVSGGVLALARNASVPFGAPYREFFVYNTEFLDPDRIALSGEVSHAFDAAAPPF